MMQIIEFTYDHASKLRLQLYLLHPTIHARLFMILLREQLTENSS